ncbi:MAG: ComEC family competence protein [Candidatus Kaiserbacteria bacterium]|nr:ComEC family competence protein [Candidatus Kaiserbacteria bacterium]
MPVKILWSVIFSFLAGVLLSSFVFLPPAFLAFLGVLAAVATFFAWSEPMKRDAFIVVAVALVSFSLGSMRMQTASRVGDPHLTAQIDKTVTIQGVVSEEPDARETSVRLTIDARSLQSGSSTVPVAARVIAIAPLHTETRYGDLVTVKGKLGLPEAFDTVEGRQFDYPNYLAKDGILYLVSYAQIKESRENRGNPIKATAIRVKRLYLDGLGAVLPEPEAGLAGGITVGDKRSVGGELTTTFQNVSLVHMLVLSGYNITVVINAISTLFKMFAQSVRFGIAGAVVVFFILMAGGAASAVRAGAMSMIAIFARVTHRQYFAERILGVVSASMVAWNPWILAFDPGFQLSALATLGLVLFTPIFARWFARVPEKFGMREIISSTCGTQLMVLPLLLYQNGTLSIYALPANLFALVAVPYAMSFRSSQRSSAFLPAALRCRSPRPRMRFWGTSS